ncbi:MAG: hypothetical protein AB7O66_04770 [Limisphaerales bacterium]
MTRRLQSVALLLVFLGQAVVACLPGASWESSGLPSRVSVSVSVSDPPPARCHGCACERMACCAPAPTGDPAPAAPLRALPSRSPAALDFPTPPGSFSVAFSDRFFGIPLPLPRATGVVRGSSPSAPPFLRGGGLLL